MSFTGTNELLYRVNLSSRIATRILVLIKEGFYKKEDDLYKAALFSDWDHWFTENQSIKVSTSAIYAPLKSLDFITLRIKDAVCDFFRKKTNKRPNVAIRDPDIKIHLFLNKNQYSLYLDASGAPLYQRGYRANSVQAPIRENLAAGIIALSGWQPGEALLDPMCGSGTFLIEAALIAKNKAPGLDRNFSFMAWKNFDAQLFNNIKTEYLTQVKVSRFMNIYGSDRDMSAVRISKKNLALADLDDCIKLSCAEFAEIKAPEKIETQPKKIVSEFSHSDFGEIEIKDMPRVKKLASTYLVNSWTTIPHVTNHDEADITETGNRKKNQIRISKSKRKFCQRRWKQKTN